MIAHVYPATQPLRGTVDPPSSKNYTTRMILASCLSAERSVVSRPALQDDSVALVKCARQLGAVVSALDERGREVEFSLEHAEEIDRLEIHGFGSEPVAPPAGQVLDAGNAGAVLRFLIGVAALADGEVTLDTAEHKESLGTRPNIDLLKALRQIGVDAEGTGESGTLPITIRGGKERIRAHLMRRRHEEGIDEFGPVPVRISGSISSQFLSSMLFLAGALEESLRISVDDQLRSRPAVRQTVRVMRDAGVVLHSDSNMMWHQIDRGTRFQAQRWEVNGDWPSSAAVLCAAAAVPGSEVGVKRLHFDDEQGESLVAEYLEAMGCGIERGVTGLGHPLMLRSPMHALDGMGMNGDLCTDAVLALEAVAALSAGESRFVDIYNLQFKECDRVREPIAELRRVIETSLPGRGDSRAWWEPRDKPDLIHVVGRPEGYEGGIEVDGRGDHRVIMMLTILGLRCGKGLRIRGAEHVSKTFPHWFRLLRSLGARIEME